jgi:hypothetical protein
VTTLEQAQLSDTQRDISSDQARAERVATERRHRRQLINLGIRVV